MILALAGCTAVLGIHRAEPDDAGSPPTTSSAATTTGTSGTGGSAVDAGCALVATDCSACLKANCTASISECLGDSECRRSLEAYAKCLPASCIDPGTCAEKKISNLDLGLCLVEKCPTECRKGRIISRCETYCACMKNACATDFGAALGGDDGCMASCAGLRTERDVYCRWTHCEYAVKDPALHCPHAIGTNDICNAVAPDKRSVCPGLSGSESGFPCQLPSDCCSKTCSASVCQ
jgi:hypothetical protein